ncbi:hypothetical protein HOLleu_41877 [Holothuria leucospilota]|uniref:Uncharacterized protein n=1 Tax=Holothuria leucospilota TaxID=206669 RepID=A0A9Q0YJT0_HOLLE|nr:hypothetical protein HOLleu_41877 [Holothuria leucospilota]
MRDCNIVLQSMFIFCLKCCRFIVKLGKWWQPGGHLGKPKFVRSVATLLGTLSSVHVYGKSVSPI